MYRAKFENGEVFLVEASRNAALKTAFIFQKTMGNLILLVEV